MTKKVKIPKRIAGVKIPKKARKTANKAIRLGASPVVRELAVAAIGAAGGKAAADRRQSSGEENGSGRRAEVHIDTAGIGEAFRTAAIDGLLLFLEGFEEGLRNLGGQAAPDEDRPKPKPASGSRPGAPRD
jgi:hypothetical protein